MMNEKGRSASFLYCLAAHSELLRPAKAGGAILRTKPSPWNFLRPSAI